MLNSRTSVLKGQHLSKVISRVPWQMWFSSPVIAFDTHLCTYHSRFFLFLVDISTSPESRHRYIGMRQKLVPSLLSALQLSWIINLILSYITYIRIRVFAAYHWSDERSVVSSVLKFCKRNFDYIYFFSIDVHLRKSCTTTCNASLLC